MSVSVQFQFTAAGEGQIYAKQTLPLFPAIVAVVCVYLHLGVKNEDGKTR